MARKKGKAGKKGKVSPNGDKKPRGEILHVVMTPAKPKEDRTEDAAPLWRFMTVSNEPLLPHGIKLIEFKPDIKGNELRIPASSIEIRGKVTKFKAMKQKLEPGTPCWVLLVDGELEFDTIGHGVALACVTWARPDIIGWRRTNP